MKLLLLSIALLIFFTGMAEAEIERFAGDNRYETSVEISQEGWESAETVILATGQNYPDALAGVPLAAQKEAPILLTRTSGLPGVTEDEINRLDPDKIILLGGEAAIEESVETSLREFADTERLYGSNRYETAYAIYEHIQDAVDTVNIVNGTCHKAALLIGPYAAENNEAILLARENEFPVDKNPDANIRLVGENAYPSFEGEVCTDFYGNTEYLTAAVTETLEPEYHLVGRKDDFADSLSGGALAAKRDEPTSILLTPSCSLSDIAKENLKYETAILGGQAAVEYEVEEKIAEVLKESKKPVEIETTCAETAAKKIVPEEKRGTYEAIELIYDWVTSNIEYDTKGASEPGAPGRSAKEVLEDRKAVCYGYAVLTEKLLNKADIEGKFAGGHVKAASGEEAAHAWNEATVNDETYALDTTWGRISEDRQTRVFLTTPEQLEKYQQDPELRWEAVRESVR